MTLTRAEALAVLTAPTGPFAIAEQVIDDRRVRAYQVGPQTLRQVLETTRSFGSADYLVYEGERYTFAEHYRLVAGLAEYLADHYRIGKGDRIALDTMSCRVDRTRCAELFFVFGGMGGLQYVRPGHPVSLWFRREGQAAADPPAAPDDRRS